MPRVKPTLDGFNLESALTGQVVDRLRPIAPQVYALLREAIIDSRLPPGAPIHEPDLARALSVSRTPLRSALQQLASEGLVETRPQVGSIVAPLNVAEVIEAVFCRSALECEVVRRLSQMSVPQERFRRVMRDQYETALRDDYLAFYRVDEEFHGLLAEMAGVPSAWRLVQSVKPHVDRARLDLMGSIAGRSLAAYNEHVAILGAIMAGDGDLAAHRMHDHVMTVFDALEGAGTVRREANGVMFPA
ncbi:MAG: hypothetical protein ABS76_08170 [Pelagibacterium sp. SCN 64-44]|nr:MAG: hypothetical protein ABS76_08170 [Pelagibacterium sp. SCN 64-44]